MPRLNIGSLPARLRLMSSENVCCSTSIRMPMASMFFFHSVSTSRYHDPGSVPRTTTSGLPSGVSR